MMEEVLNRPMVKVEIIDDSGLIRTIRGRADEFDFDINHDTGRIKLRLGWGPGFDATYSEMLTVDADKSMKG